MYYTSKSRDGIRHIANSSHVYRVTSLHSFPRWFILTTNRSVLEILSLEAYQNVRNVLRLIAPRIHLPVEDRPIRCLPSDFAERCRVVQDQNANIIS